MMCALAAPSVVTFEFVVYAVTVAAETCVLARVVKAFEMKSPAEFPLGFTLLCTK